MTYQDYVAMVLYDISVEIMRRQRVISGPDLFATTYEQAQEIFAFVLSYASPYSPLYKHSLSYKFQFSLELPVLWPAFLWELQQAL